MPQILYSTLLPGCLSPRAPLESYSPWLIVITGNNYIPTTEWWLLEILGSGWGAERNQFKSVWCVGGATQKKFQGT